MMKKLKPKRIEVSLGILFLILTLIFERVSFIHEFIPGFFTGLALCFLIIGILPEKFYTKLRIAKRCQN